MVCQLSKYVLVMFHMDDSRYFMFVSKKVWVESGEVAGVASRLHSLCIDVFCSDIGLAIQSATEQTGVVVGRQ